MLKVAMVGLGDIAQKAYLPVIAGMREQVEPILSTRNGQTLAKLKAQYAIAQVATDYQQVLQMQPDAIMIHSATDSHFKLAKQAIEAGIAVFIDKPVSYKLAETEQLVNLASQKNQPLFVGFNRRYAPAHQALKADLSGNNPVHINYQKHRYNLPDEPRIFVLDDFIHVLDSVCFFAGIDTQLSYDNLQVFNHKQTSKLAHVQVQWQQQGMLLTAQMNRLNGRTEEHVTCYGENKTWQVRDLTDTEYYAGSEEKKVSANDWRSTLEKRGFNAMLSSFFEQVEVGRSPNEQYQSILTSHQLAEYVTRQIEQC
ncbi:Gfo/Idh/MocA family oxidoreductase [Catenovulum sp. SM1970]|uniref:Gfo/Idh/MocA family protein n=1 Tax=Marinifaba aquimaris TaxID=2741323 RepID=UPI001573CEBD|nr:Gfo/Idh/MocA family oxidoreductase [Marinifaba aquimaris]NTS77421.1 Gfo/Idh/MocA family oxidoreductase [Marinifaba aquimaris]